MGGEVEGEDGLNTILFCICSTKRYRVEETRDDIQHRPDQID